MRKIFGTLELVTGGGTATGVFSKTGTGINRVTGTVSVGENGTIFDSSKVVPTADENLVKNTALPLYVKF